MSGLLPLVRNSLASCLYPITRRVEFSTNIAMALNATEQRARRRPPLTRLLLPYTLINVTERNAIMAFIESQKGPFDSSWSVCIGKVTSGGSASGGGFTIDNGTMADSDVGADIVSSTGTLVGRITSMTGPDTATYSGAGSASGTVLWGYFVPYLTMEDMDFQAVESSPNPNLYAFSLKARQTKNPGCTAAASGGAFPTFSAGVSAQLPYTLIRRYSVLISDNAISGTRYAWTWFGGGLSGFPTGSLHGWQLSFPMLPDVDLRLLEDHVRAQWGSYASFPFVDPETSTSYPHCRYSDDTFEVKHEQFNQNSVTVRIQEFNT